MITNIPFDQWDGWSDCRFAPNHFYQTRAWFSVLTAVWKDLTISIRLIDDRYALPVFTRRIGPLVLEGSPLRAYSTIYGGFLGQAPAEPIDRYLAGDFNEYAIPPNAGDALDGEATRKTILIDLTNGAETVWKAMRSETRNQVRKAIKSGVTVESSTGRAWVEPSYEIFRKTYQRQHLAPPDPIGLFYEMADRLMPSSLEVFTALWEGNIIAYAIVGYDMRTAYYIDGGLDRTYGTFSPGSLLQWVIIQWAVEHHLVTYDMAGGSIDRIAAFKASFGGGIVPYRVKEVTPSLLGKVAWRGYNMLRPSIKRIRGVMARPLSRGPHRS